MRFGVLVEFGNKLVKDLFASLVAVDFDEETFEFIKLKNWGGFGAKFLEAGGENLSVFVVGTVATVI